MSLTTVLPSVPNTQTSGAYRAREERRSRRRAKITAQAHVRSMNSEEAFEEVCKSVDVSRNGLLLIGRHNGYEKGQLLEIAFPYANVRGAENQRQTAEVVRVAEQPHGKVAFAVQFCAAKVAAQSGKAVSGITQPSGAAAERMTNDTVERITNGAVELQKQSVVLAVEPDRKGADAMRNLLEQDGYTPVIVQTAQAALDYMRANVPDALVAEVEGEGITGHDLCVIVKQNERLSRVPVILVTRAAKPEDYTTSHQLGAVICMAKPFPPERLQQVIRMVAPPLAQRTAYGACMSDAGAVQRTHA